MGKLSLAKRALVAVLVVIAAVSMTAHAKEESVYVAIIDEDSDKVGYWPLSGTLESVIGGPSGEAHGNVAYIDAPTGGQGVLLEDGAYVVMGETPELDEVETSVEFLFKITAKENAPHNPTLVAKRSADHQVLFSLHISGDYRQLILFNAMGPAFTDLVDTEIGRNQWHHVVITNDRSTGARLYLDGVSRALSPPTGFNPTARNCPLVLGAANPEGQESCNMAMASLAFYNRPLSQDEVEVRADALGMSNYRAEFEPKQRARDAAQREALEKRRAERFARIDEAIANTSYLDVGEPMVYTGEHLEAISIPVGGIGAGLIQMNGHAEPAVWQIFNNFNYVRVPDSFLAVWAEEEGHTPVYRALQTKEAGAFPAMDSLSFRGKYPFGEYDFEDIAFPLKASLEVFNPLTPMNVKDSGIPCVIYNVTLRNDGDVPMNAAVLATQQNAVGFTGTDDTIDGVKHAEYCGNINEIQQTRHFTALNMTKSDACKTDAAACAPLEDATSSCSGSSCGEGAPECNPPANTTDVGSMTLAILEKDVTGLAAWTENAFLAGAFGEDGELSGPQKKRPTPKGETVNGALAHRFMLKPGEEKTVTVLLTWYFPGETPGAWQGKGVKYTTWYESSLDVAEDVAKRLDNLTEQTRRYVDAFYAGNLPHWLLDRIASQMAILKSRTCYWTADNYFGGFEGTCPGAGCCPGNCNHVWHYAQGHARLFPEIGRMMREQAFTHQNEDGGIEHRQMAGAKPVCDGQMGDILGAYREHLLSKDDAWLGKYWPNIKKAMAFVINTWDADKDGLFHGPQFNTLDSELGGPSSWMGSLYCAALDATARMAELQGEQELACRYDALRERSAKAQQELLWNGEYFINIPDEEPHFDYANGCHIDQVLGQWWALQLGLSPIYDEEKTQSALRALIKYNYQPEFTGIQQAPRKFVADADAGLQMIQWPDEKRPIPHTLYADEVMTGFEYSAAAAMVQNGLMDRGFMVVKAIADRYDGRLRNDVTEATFASWGWTGNPFGDDECGKFYARAMSVWSMLLACQGYEYDGPAGIIGFAPVWQPEDHVSFFTTAEGYGVFSQKREGKTQTCTLDMRFGEVDLTKVHLQVPQGATVTQCNASLNGRGEKVKLTQDGTMVVVQSNKPRTLKEGDTLIVDLTFQG